MSARASGCLAWWGELSDKGVSAQEGSGGVWIGGCLDRGAVCPGDVCAGGVCVGEVSAQGCIPVCTEAETPCGQNS